MRSLRTAVIGRDFGRGVGGCGLWPCKLGLSLGDTYSGCGRSRKGVGLRSGAMRERRCLDEALNLYGVPDSAGMSLGRVGKT